MVGICLLAVAFGAALAVRAATGAHVGSRARATSVGTVVQAPAKVVTTNQIPAAPSLELPKVVKHPAHRVVTRHRAAVHVTPAVAVTAPVTHASAPPPTSVGQTSGSPSVASNPTSTPVTGSGSAGAPTTSQGAGSSAPSSGGSTGTSSGGGSSSGSGSSSGGGSSSSGGTVSGGG